MPRISATARPLDALGSSTRRMVCQRVAPSASEPSFSDPGNDRNASSLSVMTVGRIMIDSTIPAAARPKPDGELVCVRISGTSSVSPSHP